MNQKVLLFLCFFSCPYFSANPVNIGTDTQEVLLGPNLSIFEDKDGTAIWSDVIAGRYDAAFKPQNKQVPNFGSTRSIIYGKVEIFSKNVAAEEYLLELGHPVLDYVDVVVQDLPTGKIIQSWATGDLRPFATRPINHRNFLFPLKVFPCRILIRISSESSLMIPLTILKHRAHIRKESFELIFIGAYYGLMIVMVIYNSIMAFAMRTLSGHFYSLYMFFLLLTQTMLDGVFYQAFPQLTFLNNMGITFWGSFAMAFGLLFSYQYLRLSALHKFHRYAIYFLVSFTLIGGLLAISAGYRTGSVFNRITGILLPVTVMTYGGIRYRQGFHPAKFFLFGFGCVCVAVILFSLSRFGVLDQENFFIYRAMQIGSALEAILLSFGLADRIRVIQKEKEIAQAATIEQQRILNEAFARFVPAPFLQILGKKSIPEVLLGDYTEREMTILFADIRSFTTISEKLTPKQTFEFINNYLQGSGPVIRNHHGFIDKYMGDGIMALFEQREDAIRAALRLQSRNARLNKSLKGKLVAPLKVGIGIHSGHLMLGTIGEPQRMDGTVISDAVNLASRVESLTKQYGVDILVTKETFAGMQLGTVQRPFVRRFIDRIAVKGKVEPTTIYEVVPLTAGQVSKYSSAWLEKWVLSIRLYYEANFREALSLFIELEEQLPSDRTCSIFKQRCEGYITNPPESSWNGVAIATSK